MNKKQLLDLEKNAHLSVTELRRSRPAVARVVDARLRERAHRTAMTRLANSSDTLREVAASIAVPLDVAPERTRLGEATLDALRAAVADDPELAENEELVREIEALDTALTRPGVPGERPEVPIADSLLFDVPIAFNPEFRRDLDAARIHRLSDATGLGVNTARVLIDRVGSVGAITDDRLDELVKDNTLSAADAGKVGEASSLYHVLDERPELVASASATVGDVRELVKHDQAAWVRIITDSRTEPPGGISVDEYANVLVRKVENLFPTDALAAHLGAVDVGGAVTANNGLDRLRRANPGTPVVGAHDFSSLNTDGISTADVRRLAARYDTAVRLDRRYAGMQLAEVMDDANLTAADRNAEITRCTGLANSFFADNAEVLAVDLTPGSDAIQNLTFAAGASDADKAMVLSNTRAYQRALAVTDDLANAEALVTGGYGSALAVANTDATTLTARTGVSASVADRYIERAKGIALGTVAHVGTVLDIFKGGFGDLAVGNLAPAIEDYLKEIPGFADFFGNQDFCDCEHCKSIFGPAAYFVDLMCFVDDNVTKGVFGSKPNHPLNLKVRRPDLWTLDLTCENTNTSIPYLVIINEILENAVARDAGFAGNFGDREAVRTKVYKDTLPDQVNSFQQPLNLPFEELRTYLGHFDRSLIDLAEAGNADGDVLARLRLALPPRDFQLITVPNANMPFLRRVYGIQFTEAGGTIDAFDAQLLLKPMGINRDELGELIATRYVTADGAANIRIRGEKRSAESVQNDIENIRGLTRVALDRMHRFVRLWRATGWRIDELDLLLTHLRQAGLSAEIDAPTVGAVARTYRHIARLNVPLEEFVALFSRLPQLPTLRSVPASGSSSSVYPQPVSPLARYTISLFDRLFNQKRFVSAGGGYPQPGTFFLHPAFATAPPANVDPNLHRLLAGLGVDEDQLYQIVLGLAKPLGIDPASANDADKQFPLTHHNLSLLYRHARLAGLLKASIPDVFALAGLTPGIPMAHVEDLSDLTALLELHDWWKATRWSLSDLLAIVRPGLPPVVTSPAPVANTAGGETVTYTATLDGVAQAAETVTFAANADLAAAVADWNGQAQHTVAYRSDPLGNADSAGTHLAIRTASGTGIETTVEVTADSAGLFAPGVPLTVAGSEVPPPGPPPDAPSADELAQELVLQVRQASSLVFSDTVFALLPPIAPVATSAAPLAGTGGGETVTYTPRLNGRTEAAETITFAASATLDAVVADWNQKASFTRAYRSDAAGIESPTGDHLSVSTRDAAGSTTRLTITADSASIFTAATPREYRGTEIRMDQSRAIVAANTASFEAVDAEGRYRLRSGFDPDAALVLPAGIDPTLGPALLDVLRAFHTRRILLSLLPGQAGVSPEIAAELVTMLGVDLDDNAFFLELRGDAPPAGIAALIPRLKRLDSVFEQESVFGAETLAFIQANLALFGIDDVDRITVPSLRRIERYRTIREAWLGAEGHVPDVDAVLLAFDPATRFAPADQADLAAILECDAGLSQSLQANLALSTTAIEALEELIPAVELARHVGIGGAALRLVQSSTYDDLAAASDAVEAAFRAKYEDEAEWETRIEPYRDALLSRQRDGLVAALIFTGTGPFDEVSDLYEYFLLDVELEGCMRTSRVAAAIDSVQLYVHRCLMNLEESPPGAADPVHVLPTSIPEEEWTWRKNYRVWEANRKIFLYPENWIEPELRDDKTPLFEALEEELLSKELTDEEIVEAYGAYLRGFDELAHLTIAGAYHEVDEDTQRDVLHLFGVTADDPPVFYYRRVEDAHYGAANDERATFWSAWERLNIQVPVRRISPVIHQGQLYVFWIRYVTKPQNTVKNGESRFSGYQHRAYVEFSRRKVDGSWTTPQRLRLDESPFGPATYPESYQDDGVVLDPIVPKSSTSVEILWFDFTFYSNFEPLYDDQAHEVPKDDYTLDGFAWDRLYPGTGSEISLRGTNFQMWSGVDLYRMKIRPPYVYTSEASDEGVPWLNPVIFIIIWLLSGGQFELTSLLPPRLVWSRAASSRRDLHTTPSGLPCFDTYTYASLLVDEARFKQYEQPLAATDPAGSAGVWTGPQWDEVITDYLASILKENKIGDIPADATVEVVNGSVGDVIIQTNEDAFYLQAEVRGDGKYHLRRLTTSVSADIADVLFNGGLERLLATPTQLGLKEHPTGINVVGSKVFDDTGTGSLDFQGPMGAYLREIFFHIPALIANHLNSQGRFEDAQRWYHYIFDPTSTEAVSVPGGLSDEERRRRELDRNWRYREFRGLDLDTLRKQLTDQVAIEQYKRDPFNPHAIARLRISAYQKSIVMKYVDNLLDWGDDLFIKAFSQLNPEYLREATLKYVTAQQILGDRPAKLGACEDARLRTRSFDGIKAAMDEDSEFLIEFESYVATRYRVASTAKYVPELVSIKPETGMLVTKKHYASAAPAGPWAVAPAIPIAEIQPTRESVKTVIDAVPAATKEVAARATFADTAVIAKADMKRNLSATGLYKEYLRERLDWAWAWAFVREVNPVFCVPGNERMLANWDRVEDRLYKLRHCQDIDGVYRLLPLFAPEIDPGLLVAGAAAGLSLEDVLAAGASAVPPYRFRYLIEKARAFASTVQGFGSALLSALEKRDAEELSKLRNVHQKNILTMTTEVRRNELKVAEESVEIVARRQAAIQYRKDYYEQLISTGLTTAETIQFGAQLTVLGVKATQTAFAAAAGITYLLPQVGSPFAMKYGGDEVGSSLKAWSAAIGILGQVAEITGSIAGTVAGYERREQGWEHQMTLADLELKTVEKEAAVAELRRRIATRSLELHDKTRDQHDEIMDFFESKFSNLGLYTHLSRSLQQLHREAYNNALALARLAEQAYRFERPGDSTVYVGGEWDASRSGLLAGERLLMALNTMDKRFIEGNARYAEVNQSFSLAQLDPQALIDLKEIGSCEFAIPEFAFDLYYPGHYRRRIQAVRLTIPCITGAYTNVSATLRLIRSHIRKDAVLGAANLHEVPVSGTSSVAMSTAQGDAGVFELNFRDEKYLPFEGAGAVSEWRLELPPNFRPFDYQTINDVILNISYTAEQDETLRQQVNTQNAALEGSLLNYLSNNTLTRVISLRQEFSSAFHRLTEAATGTPVTLELTDRHFPLFLQGQTLAVAGATMVLAVEDRTPAGSVSVSVNGAAVTGFSNPTDPPAAGDPFGGLPARAIPAAGFNAGLKRQHTLTVNDAGNLDAAVGATFAPDKLRDILLVIEYRV